MNDSGMLLTLLLIFGLIFCLTVILLTTWMIRQMQTQMDHLRIQNQDLMNRIQSGDLKTFLSLQTNQNPLLNPSFDYTVVSKSDGSELKQLQDMGQAQGLGYELYDDDELLATLGEFGFSTGASPEQP